MKINHLLIAGVCILITACQNQKNHSQANFESKNLVSQFDLPDSLSTRRISFVLDLKKSVAKNTWSDFGKKNNEGTLIYFDADWSELFFPNSVVVNKLHKSKKHSDNYWLTKKTDSIPYHMEVMISFNIKDSLEFFFKNPIEQYSSVEEIGKYIPVESTEMWSTMVIHEMFHHFQYNNSKYLKYAETVIGVLPFDSRNLVALCQEDKQFLSMIRNENDILMTALAEEDKVACDSLVSAYLKTRNKRISKYNNENPHLEQVENYYIIQEGSARYIEYKSMFILKSYFNKPDAPVILKDPKFINYKEFQEIDLNDDAFNYLIYAGATDYHYTIGFNIMRLLDKLQFEYKKTLLDKPEKGLHKYLEDYINNLPNNN